MEGNKLGIYLHFPFCVRKCRYCDFLSFPSDAETMQRYAKAMCREIRAAGKSGRGHTVDSVFLGGGTPSVVPAGALQNVMDALRETFAVEANAEITMEMNPGTVKPENLSFIKENINRVSMGVQSADDRELEMLGRIHTWEDACESFVSLRNAGIENINIDLISAIPGQNPASWRKSLAAVCGLAPEHISAYSLIVEEGTPFFALQQAGRLALPGEDEEREMYYETKKILAAHGYERYEISNYARPGFQCRHNKKYWERGDYLGFGIGAASLFGHRRWRNTGDIRVYISESGAPDRIRRDVENLSRADEMEEFMFLGLREMRGVSEKDFRETFGNEIMDVYGDMLRKLKKEELMDTAGGRWFLTDRGIDVSNIVMAEFML